MKLFKRAILIMAVIYGCLTVFVLLEVGFGGALFYPGQRPWRLIWHDEFNAEALDLSKWTVVNQGSNYANELQAFVDENVVLHDGKLVITGRRERWTGPDNFKPGYEVTREYTSGQLYAKSSWTYGKFEIRAKVAGGRGVYSYAALYPPDGTWPPEVGIMGSAGRNPRSVHMFNFWGPDYMNYHMDYSGPMTGPDFSKAFHTFTAEWEPGVIRWYVDGKLKYKIKRNVPNQPLCPVIKLAVGGDGAGEVEDGPGEEPAVFPQIFQIDYIRVYQRG